MEWAGHEFEERGGLWVPKEPPASPIVIHKERGAPPTFHTLPYSGRCLDEILRNRWSGIDDSISVSFVDDEISGSLRPDQTWIVFRPPELPADAILTMPEEFYDQLQEIRDLPEP